MNKRRSDVALLRALLSRARAGFVTLTLVQGLWWAQAPLLLAVGAPLWSALALALALGAVRQSAARSLRLSLRRHVLAESATRALEGRTRLTPESDADAAFWAAYLAEYVVSTALPSLIATGATTVLCLAMLTRLLGALGPLLIAAVFALAGGAMLLVSRSLSPRVARTVEARQSTAVWLSAALRGSGEFRGANAKQAYLARIDAAVLAWCRAEDSHELRRTLSRGAILALTSVALLLVISKGDLSLLLRAARGQGSLALASAGIVLLTSGYAALRAASDLWVAVEELARVSWQLEERDDTAQSPEVFLTKAPSRLSAAGLELRYQSHVVLTECSFEVPLSAPLLIVGPNGAGKTTLASAIAGLRAPSKGTLRFDAHDCGAIAKDDVAFVPQEPALVESLSIAENVRLAAPSADDAALRVMLDRVGISQELTHRTGSLSRGERQRVGLARSLLTAPKVLVLDEPDAWLDAAGRAKLRAILTDEGSRRAVIVVSHRDDLRSVAGAVLLVENGFVREQPSAKDPSTVYHSGV